MNLSSEVATLLREALQEAYDTADRHPSAAYRVLDKARAFNVLAKVIERLLEPLPEAPDTGQPADLFAPYLASKDEKDLPW